MPRVVHTFGPSGQRRASLPPLPSRTHLVARDGHNIGATDVVLALRARGWDDMRVVGAITQRSFARFVAFDLAVAARRMGWAVHWIDFDALTQELAGSPRDAWIATLARVTDEVRAFAPDVVFSYGVEAILPPFPDVLPEEPWRLADAARAPVACFFYDFGAPLDRPVDATTAPYVERLQRQDIRVFCWDRHAVADLVRFGVAVEYLPMAVNDAMCHPPPAAATRDLPIVFSGGPNAERVTTLRSLAPAGLSVYGYDEPGWTADPVLAACYRGFVPERDRLRAIYQRAQTTLNVTRAHGRASLNMRVFEAMACGCLVVTDQAEEAAALFSPGEDLVTVPPGTAPDAVVTHYLADTAARTRIAARGARVVREAHTYVHRLESITPCLEAFTTETRAWTFWEQFIIADPGKALRFVAALRADRALLREDLWHVADTTAHIRLGRWGAARRSLDEARRCNPGLRRLQGLEAELTSQERTEE